MNGSMDDVFHINFGVGVGWLQLGDHINDILETFSSEYPRLELELTFADESVVSTSEIRINVPTWGIHLHFQPLSQVLYFIDVYDFNVSPSFNINGYVIRGQEQATTFSQLQKTLGPIFPGKFIDEGKYLLTFDGVGLLFNVPLEFQNIYADGKKLPIILPNNSSAILQRVYVFRREFKIDHPELFSDPLPTNVGIILIPKSPNSPCRTHIHLTHLLSSKPNDLDPAGVEKMECSKNVGSKLEGNKIELGMNPQDVVSILGMPDFASLSPPHVERYVHKYEYRRLGIEVYFAKATHALFQIVLHTNHVLHQDFSRFRRCGFSISPICFQGNTDCCTCVNENKVIDSTCKGSDGQDQSDQEICDTVKGFIDAITPWERARSLLSQWFPSSCGAVASNDESSSCHHKKTPAAIKPVPAGCPFSPTELYAYPSIGVMFEVASGGILSSVTLMDPQLIN